MEDNFYMVLPSDTISNNFTNNVLGCYTVDLPKGVDFGNKTWEVALVGITYPHSWYHIRDEQSFINIQRTRYEEYPLPFGYFKDASELAKMINIVVSADNRQIEFKYDHPSNLFTITAMYPFKLSIFLAKMLGFETGNYIAAITEYNERREANFTMSLREQFAVPFSVTAKFCVDLELNTHNLFVYSNVVKESIVGNEFMPLLRTVATNAVNRNQYVTIDYDVPHYLPLSSNNIKFITIDIRNGLGKTVDFRYGKITVKLHFRVKT